MFLIKHNDDMVHAAAKAGRLNLIYYSPRGQEVIPSAISVQLTDEDYVCTIYRGVHDQLAKGLPAKLIWAEYAGRSTGSCKGKGGPMHITHPETGVMVTTGVVGSSMPIAVGLGLASQVKGDKRVTVANFGDGASNIGAFHESMNLASCWKLPVIFMCQNNQYAEHSRFEKFTAGGSVSRRAEAYGMPGITVDGNDPAAMWHAAKEAIDRARAGGGPTLIEANTFRFEGHLLGDPGDYIPAEDMAAARERDPVVRVRGILLDEGHVTAEALDALEAAVRKEIKEAEEFALSSPWPEVGELATDVLDTTSEPLSSIPVPA
ncbi:thiamine pyrophosphate-dependent dehydrogenase E1 component subunit alpha [Sphingomonas sp. YL-JM2C]